MQKEQTPEKKSDSILNKKEEGKVGPVVGSIIIIVIIIMGAFYFFSLAKERTGYNKSNDSKSSEEPAPTAEELREQSKSDEISDIEADLNAENFDNLGAELNEIDSEFEAN